MLADDLIAAVERHSGRPGRRVGHNTRLLCPAHDDHNPSLDIAAAPDGRALVICRSHGCTYEAILEALGIEEQNPNGAETWTPHGDAIVTYPYVDADNTLVYEVCKTADKQYPQRRPDPGSKTGWRWKLDGVERVLYHLPDVLEAVARGKTIHVVEGEKDVDRLRRLGLVATCNPGGAGKWRDTYSQVLAGAHVIVIADHDDAGIAHAADVFHSLVRHGATVELLRPPVEGHDVSDHLSAGGSLETLEPLEGEHVPAVEIIFEPLRDFLKRDLPPSVSLVGAARDATNLLPQYGWVMPWGRAGSGKTSILVDLLFHAAAGIAWLGYPIARPLRIVAIVNEGIPGGLQDKLAQKLERWGHDPAPVLDNLFLYASPWGEFTFASERMVDHARAYALDVDADYVALDPLHTFGTSGSGAPDETEQFKHRLRDFGLWADLGIITSHHANKAGMVSGDWMRHPDTVFHVEKDGKNPATRYTLEKARPADPAELGVPQLLHWLVETYGYERETLDVTPTFDEAEALASVLDALSRADGPMGKQALAEAVGGTNARVLEVIAHAIKSGEIVDLTPEKRSFKLVLPGSFEYEPKQPEATLFDEAQKGMVEPSSSFDDAPKEPEAAEAAPEDRSVPSASAPSLEGDEVAEVTNGAEADDDDNPFPVLR